MRVGFEIRELFVYLRFFVQVLSASPACGVGYGISSVSQKIIRRFVSFERSEFYMRLASGIGVGPKRSVIAAHYYFCFVKSIFGSQWNALLNLRSVAGRNGSANI